MHVKEQKPIMVWIAFALFILATVATFLPFFFMSPELDDKFLRQESWAEDLILLGLEIAITLLCLESGIALIRRMRVSRWLPMVALILLSIFIIAVVSLSPPEDPESDTDLLVGALAWHGFVSFPLVSGFLIVNFNRKVRAYIARESDESTVKDGEPPPPPVF